MMKIRSRIAAAFLSSLACLGAVVPASAGTLLPNGMQYFTDSNGLPLSAACVYFYIPGTSTAKDTYTSSDQSVANLNPVQLDAAGRAIIYGTGVYRQLVKASPCGSTGVTVWDQLTASTDSSATIYAGASAGTPNAVTVNAPAFSGTSGQVINYISTSTNSGAATFNPSGFGAFPIVRDSVIGPAALTGGELVATNAVSLIYDATAGTFHILSPVNWPNTSGVPVGTTIAVSGFNAPTGYAFAYGQAVSRTTYAALFTAFTSAQTGSITSGSAVITGLSDTTQFGYGKPVEALGIPAGAQVLSCTSTSCTMSANATLTRTGTMTFFAYGDGDGSITFNLPDYSGRSLIGRDNLSGTATNTIQTSTTLTTTSASTTATVASATNLAVGMVIIGNPNVTAGTTISAISGTTITMSAAATGTAAGVATRFSALVDPQALGSGGGVQVTTLLTSNLPPYTPAGTISVTGNVPLSSSTPYNNTFVGGSQPIVQSITPTALNITGQTFTGTAQGGTSIPFSSISPVRTVNWAVRLIP